MSHEKGIEAAARAAICEFIADDVDDYFAHCGDKAIREAKLSVNGIIAAYLAEAQPTSEGEEREAFEAWCRDEFGIGTVLRKSRDGFYDDTLVQLRWLAWQARSAREGGKP